jgi:hypothetical protein
MGCLSERTKIVVLAQENKVRKKWCLPNKIIDQN